MPSRISFLKAVYSKPMPIIVTAIFIVMYYVLFQSITSISNQGLAPILTTPSYLIYSLVLTSAVLLFLSAYSLKISLYNIRSNLGSGISVGSTVIGALIAGCECQAPILSIIMYNLGLNSISVSTLLSFVGEYETIIIFVLVLSNILYIYYNLGKMSSNCMIKNGNVVAKKSSLAKAGKKKWF